MLTPEQLEMRRTGIGASEVAAVVGWSPWQSPMAVFNQKIGLSEPPTSTFMAAGNWLEPAIADWFAAEEKVRLQRCNQTLRHKKHSWALATPDRFVLAADGHKRDRLLEIKTVGRTNSDWGDPGTDEVPKYYLAQVTWAMEVTGMPSCDVAALFLDSREMRVYHVPFSKTLADALLEEVGDFWHNHILPRVPPIIDASDASKKYLHATFQDVSEQIADAPPDAEKWVREYVESRTAEATARDRKEEATNMLKAYIGARLGMRGPWGVATWKMTKTNGTDWEAAARYLLTELEHVGVTIKMRDLMKQFPRRNERRLRLTFPRTGR